MPGVHSISVPSKPVSQAQGHAPGSSAQPKLLDRFREALRSRHYSRRTEQTYCLWVKRFIYFHKDVKTQMIYTHVLNRGGKGVKSPVDEL
jgi:hypothetical protein